MPEEKEFAPCSVGGGHMAEEVDTGVPEPLLKTQHNLGCGIRGGGGATELGIRVGYLLLHDDTPHTHTHTHARTHTHTSHS